MCVLYFSFFFTFTLPSSFIFYSLQLFHFVLLPLFFQSSFLPSSCSSHSLLLPFLPHLPPFLFLMFLLFLIFIILPRFFCSFSSSVFSIPPPPSPVLLLLIPFQFSILLFAPIPRSFKFSIFHLSSLSISLFPILLFLPPLFFHLSLFLFYKLRGFCRLRS